MSCLPGLQGPPDTESWLLNPLTLSNTAHDAGLVARVHDGGVLLGPKVVKGPVNGEALLASKQGKHLFSLNSSGLLKVVRDLTILGERALWKKTKKKEEKKSNFNFKFNSKFNENSTMVCEVSMRRVVN